MVKTHDEERKKLNSKISSRMENLPIKLKLWINVVEDDIRSL